jgi:hypothetical protein
VLFVAHRGVSNHRNLVDRDDVVMAMLQVGDWYDV